MSVPLTEPNNKPDRMRCPECGLIYYNEPHHREQCDGQGTALCGKLVFGRGIRARYCWFPKGHVGPCR